jgi:replicative DNA helicase
MPTDQIAAFVRHLWATDGSLSVNASAVGRQPAVRLYYASTSRRLVDGLQSLLLRLGIQSRVSRVVKGEHRPNYHLRIDGAEPQRRFLQRVGVHGSRGRLVAAALRRLDGIVANPNVDTIPNEVRPMIVSALRSSGMSHRDLAVAIGELYCGSYLLGSARRPRSSSRDRLERIAHAVESKNLLELATSDVLWDRVVAIEPLGEQPVYDATVLSTHNFIANGIVAHNSLEQDADVVMPTGVLRLVFRGQYARFDNAAPRGMA